MSATNPTLDSELYSFATLRAEQQAIGRIRDSFDTEELARWFGAALRDAYATGLRDGYVQGRHDHHNNGEAEGRNPYPDPANTPRTQGVGGVGPALHGENAPDSPDAT